MDSNRIFQGGFGVPVFFAISCVIAGCGWWKKEHSNPSIFNPWGRNIRTLDTLLNGDSNQRQQLASAIEADFSQLLDSTDPGSGALQAQIRALVLALNQGLDALCAPEDRVRLFRGQGIGVNFADRSGKTLIVSDAILEKIGYPYAFPMVTGQSLAEISGGDWESEVQNSRILQTPLQLANLIRTFAKSDNISSRTRKPFGESIADTDFEELAARHAEGATRSPFLSFSALPDVGAIYGPPYFVIETCPSRLGVSQTSVPYEREALIFGLTLPEESVELIDGDLARLQRLIVGRQVNGSDLSPATANWITDTIEKSRTSFLKSMAAYHPPSPWAQCLAGVPVALKELNGHQFQEVNSTYASLRHQFARSWQDAVAVNLLEPQKDFLASCTCLSWVQTVNQRLLSEDTFDAEEVCPP